MKHHTDTNSWETDETMRIKDDGGRIGIVSEIRDYTHGPGIFARPEGMPYLADAILPGIGPAKLITATWWAKQADGSYRGRWADSPLNTELVAHKL